MASCSSVRLSTPNMPSASGAAPAGLLNRPLARHDLGIAPQHNASVRSFLTKCASEGGLVSLRGNGVLAATINDAVAKGPTGRDRAWQRIERAMVVPPLVSEPRLRVWRHLIGRDHPFQLPDDRPGRPSFGRDAVEVRYVAMGSLQSGLIMGGGAWSFAVSDHAIGRIYERSPGVDPRHVILEAHDGLLSLTADDVALLLDRGFWTVPTVAGAFLVNVRMIIAGAELQIAERDRELGIYVFADTYLDQDALHPAQEAEAALLQRRAPRYLDGALCPAALRPPIHMPPEALQ